MLAWSIPYLAPLVLLFVGLRAAGLSVVASVGIVSAVAILAIAAVSRWRSKRRRDRLSWLRAEYGDEEVAQRILGGHYWPGQTAKQLVDALGKPHAVDQKVMKTRKREVWKYGHRGGRRYALRVTLDDDVVTGWAEIE